MKLSVFLLVLGLVLGTAGCASDGSFDSGKALAVGAGVLHAATLDENSVKQTAALTAKEMDSKNKVAPANSPYTLRLARITAGLPQATGLNLNFKVYISDQINAFAMADGTVRVYSGLLDAMPDDQVLAARLLRLVNSSFYGFPQRISTITGAIVLLGFDARRLNFQIPVEGMANSGPTIQVHLPVFES